MGRRRTCGAYVAWVCVILAGCGARAPTARTDADAVGLQDVTEDVASVTADVAPDTSSAADVTVSDVADLADVMDAPAADAVTADGDAGDVPPPPTQAKGQFVDVWSKLGLQLATAPGDKGKFIEPSSSAGLWADLDKDGQVDYVLVDGINKAVWGRALQPWKWYDAPLLTAKEPGLISLAVTDEDADGYPEIVLGGGRLYYLVRTKAETYVEVAAQRNLQISNQSRAQHIAVTDLDADGLLDLVVTEYSCTPAALVRGFVNQGNHMYADETKSLGIGHNTTAWFTLPGDADGDGLTDLLVGHEACQPTKGNAFLRNLGPGANPRFATTVWPPLFLAPTSTGSTPMGAAWGDFDGNGVQDVLLSETGLRDMVAGGLSIAAARANPALAKDWAMGANHLLLREKTGESVSVGLQLGLGWATSSTGFAMTSWSVQPLDFDGDGWLDVLLSHGFDLQGLLLADEGGQRPVLFRNQAGQGFVDVSAQFGLPQDKMGRALAAADVDGDGDLDFWQGGMDGQPLVLRNDVTHPNHWLQVQLQGTVSNIWGLGALVELDCGDRVITSPCTTQAPTQTANLPIVHFGVPASCKPKELRVKWPSGFAQVVKAPALDKRLVVQEPPLITLSARWVSTVGPASVTVTAQAFDAQGFVNSASTIDFSLDGAAKGSWAGPATCDGLGLCKRVWQVAAGKWGADAVTVSFDGTPLRVRPTIRYDK